jgi:hypothetical protein
MLTLQTNDTIEGVITVAPNARNPRDLDIVIDYKVDGQHPHQERREYRMCVSLSSSPFGAFARGAASLGRPADLVSSPLRRA